MTVDKNILTRSWAHSHEEDAAGNQVFRPSDHAMRPSRGGRTQYQFSPDGTVQITKAGPDDRRVQVSGHWQLNGKRLTVQRPDSATPQEFDIDSAEADKLIIRPLAGG
jgi:hypothetical protein